MSVVSAQRAAKSEVRDAESRLVKGLADAFSASECKSASLERVRAQLQDEERKHSLTMRERIEARAQLAALRTECDVQIREAVREKKAAEAECVAYII